MSIGIQMTDICFLLDTFLDPGRNFATESSRNPAGYAGHTFSISTLINTFNKGLCNSHGLNVFKREQKAVPEVSIFLS